MFQEPNPACQRSIDRSNQQVEAGQRASTLAAHHEAVAQVIPAMQRRYGDSLSLVEMADMAALSPCHFNRVFRKITGITPARFLCALRLQAATQLLLTTQLSVTDVCFEVGYNSLGTFTSRFTELIGLPPSRLRELADSAPPVVDLVANHADTLIESNRSGSEISGCASTTDQTVSMIFIGLFPTAIPQGTPITCTVLREPGAYRLRDVPDGRYHIFAAGFPQADDSTSLLMPDSATVQVGMGEKPLAFRNGRVKYPVDIHLRTIEVTDPPILSALPHLLLTKCAALQSSLKTHPSLN